MRRFADFAARCPAPPFGHPGATGHPSPGGPDGWAGQPGAGAAGGLGFAALAFLGAQIRPGIGLVLELISFAARLPGASLVVTGEGALDEQTLHGKAPAGVAAAAVAAGVPVVAVAGRNTLPAHRLREAGLAAAYALTDLEPDLARARANAGPLVERVAVRIAADWLPDQPGQDPGAGTLTGP